jgi:hypothetical protein
MRSFREKSCQHLRFLAKTRVKAKILGGSKIQRNGSSQKFCSDRFVDPESEPENEEDDIF